MKTKKIIGLIIGELDWQMIKEFVGLTAKHIWKTAKVSYLKNSSDEEKKSKGTKKCQDYKTCVKAAQIENIRNRLEKNWCR